LSSADTAAANKRKGEQIPVVFNEMTEQLFGTLFRFNVHRL